MSSSERPTVFISYSHLDKAWLDHLQTMLRPSIRANRIVAWDDTQIEPGAQWKATVAQALRSAKVAVLLVSRHFLASDFIVEHELQPLLKASATGGRPKILWIALSHCLYEEVQLHAYQAANDPTRPLDTLSTAEQNQVLAAICRTIKRALDDNEASDTPPPVLATLLDRDDELGDAISGIVAATPSPYGTQGFVRRYMRGSIYHITGKGNPAAGWPALQPGTCFTVSDDLIGKYYESRHGTGSRLGFPLGNVEGAWDNTLREDCTFRGHVQWFEGGSLYQLARFGAHAVYAGPIFDKFRGFEIWIEKHKGVRMTGGVLGFPIADEQDVTSSTGVIGTVQRFIYGCIVRWQKGVFVVAQGLYDLYESTGAWAGALGFPLADDEEFISTVSGTRGSVQRFENGCGQWNAHAFYVVGPMYEQWQKNAGRLGFALNSACVGSHGDIQYFEGGRIEHRDGRTHVVYS